MNFRIGRIAFVVLACVLPLHAKDMTPNTTAETLVSTTTISASTLIAPGRYTLSVAPNFNSAMAKRLEEAIGKIPGLSAIQARSEDSSIHFTVKEGAHVRSADIQRVVKKTDNGAVTTAPILEGSMAPRSGI